MKSILVPTDFSPAAANALEYALKLAARTKASVTVLNVYHVPLPAGEVPLMLISPHEILEKTHEQLDALVSSAKLAYENKFPVQSMTRQGFAGDEIINAASELKADLIVMGTKGAASPMAAFLGSVATAVMRKCPVPVLVIPHTARFLPVKRIAFAFDYDQPSGRTALLLKQYAQVFGAEVDVVNVVTPTTKTDMQTAVAGIGMDDVLAAVPHHLFFLEGEEVVDELSEFARDHKSDWLVVVPHAHGFFQSLFHRSISSRAAMQIAIPILSIHE